MRSRLRWLTLPLMLVIAAVLLVRQYPLTIADQLTRVHLWRSGVESEFVTVDGHRIHFFEAVPPNGRPGTPLVLVHGLGARGEDWAAMIAPLAAAGFHVWAPDLLGYGRSDRPDQPDATYTISSEEVIVEHFMTALHLGQADVAGWSMGGWVAMKLAIDHPERVRRLVVYDSAGVYFPTNFGMSIFVPQSVAGVQRLMNMLTPNAPVIPAFIGRDALRKFQNNGWVIQRSVAAMASGRDLLEFRLVDLHEPMLVVWGAEDALIPLSAGEKIHRLVTHSNLAILEGCGHLAPLTCAAPALRSTVQFLRSDPPATGQTTRYSFEPGSSPFALPGSQR